MASFSLKKSAKASCTRAILLPLRTRGKQIFPSSASPRRDLRGCVKFPPPRPMVAPAWRASQAKRRLPPRGEPCDRRRPATSEATVAHGKPYTAADMLRGPARPPPPSGAPPYHPAPLLLPIRMIPKKKFCPIFGVNLRILPISGACRPASATPPSRRFFEALAWQACHPCYERASAYAFRLRQACAEASRSPKTCDRGKEPRGLQ